MGEYEKLTTRFLEDMAAVRGPSIEEYAMALRGAKDEIETAISAAEEDLKTQASANV